MIEFLVWFVACLISTFGFTYLFYKLADCRVISFKSIFIFFVGVLSITLIKYYNIPVISFSYFFVFYPILFYSLQHLSIKKLIYYLLVVWFIGMLFDLLVMILMSFIHYAFSFNILDNWTFASIISSLVICFLFLIISHIKILPICLNKLYNHLIKIKFSDLLIIFLALYIFISAFVILVSLPNLTIDILLNLLIFLIIVVFIFLIKYKIYEEEIVKYLQILKDNNDFYINANDENRIFKHNLISKLLSVKSVSNKKAKVLIDELIKDFNKNMIFLNNIKNIPYGLNGVIYQKLYLVNDKINITINNSINYDIFNVLKPLRYNVLIEKMSIVLDNAIEASLKSREKIINIYIYEKDNSILIEIKNSFNDVVDLDNLGKINYSSKGKKRGLGLFSALRNNEATLKVNVINNFFVSKIAAQKK